MSRRPRRGRLPARARIAVPALAVTRAPTGTGAATATGTGTGMVVAVNTGTGMAGGTAGTRTVGTITASTAITAGND